MPLSRLNDGFEIELEGIAFGMVDRQGHRWRCLITDRVLSDAIGGAPTQKDKTAWFRANRSSGRLRRPMICRTARPAFWSSALTDKQLFCATPYARNRLGASPRQDYLKHDGASGRRRERR